MDEKKRLEKRGQGDERGAMSRAQRKENGVREKEKRMLFDIQEALLETHRSSLFSNVLKMC